MSAADKYHEFEGPAIAGVIEQMASLVCAADAELLTAIVAFDRAEHWRPDGMFSMRDWLVMALNVSAATASEWVRVATALDELPALRALHACGELSWDQVRQATRFATAATDEALAAELPAFSAAQIERMARERQPLAARDANEAHAKRRFSIRPTRAGDGWRLGGFLPPEQGAVVSAAIAQAATDLGPDPATGLWAPQHQRQADALVAVADQQLGEHPPPDHAVVVHIDSEVVEGLEAGNGALPNGMQLPRDSILRLLCDGQIEFHVDGPDGATIGIGRTSRRIPRWLARRIHHRDAGICRFPGCGRRIRHVHHVAHWRDGGATDAANLIGLCWEHHHLVHEGGWDVLGHADGELTFVSPWGRELRCRPAPLARGTRQHLEQQLGIHLDDPKATGTDG